MEIGRKFDAAKGALVPRSRLGIGGIAVFWLAAVSMLPASAQGMPEGTPGSWAAAAAENEANIVQMEGRYPLRYRVHKVDGRGDTTREVIETKDGGVARLVERDGRPLSAAEDADEQERLKGLLASPDEFMRHHRRDGENRDYTLQMVKLMPQAMIYSYAPGQPQPQGAQSPQVVVDFRPDPAFKPPNMISNALTGLEGRGWIDAKSKRLTRVEARVVKPVNFGWGILARIFPGGTIVFEQSPVGGDRWAYSHLEEHVTVRELMVRTVPQNSVMTAGDFRPMAQLPAYQDAIKMLLAMVVKLQ